MLLRHAPLGSLRLHAGAAVMACHTACTQRPPCLPVWRPHVELINRLLRSAQCSLRDCNYVAEPDQEVEDSFPNTVSGLSAATLRHACFDETELPRTVAALSGLEALHFGCPESQCDAAADLLAALLPSLRRLTALALIGVPLRGQVRCPSVLWLFVMFWFAR